MAANYTANYQLNQWEPEDKVLRTDFNADNLKIDGAIKAEELARADGDDAVRAALEKEVAAREAAVAACPVVKVLDYTSTSAQNQINIPMTGINLLDYLWLDVLIESTERGQEFYVRVNNVSSGYGAGRVGSLGSQYTYLAHGMSVGAGVYLRGRLFIPPAGEQLLLVYLVVENSVFNIYQANCSIKPSEVSTLNLVCANSGGTLPAGTRVKLIGVKRN